MRLPADAVLLIIDAQEAIEGLRQGAGACPEVETTIAALIAAWRTEGLPLAHVGRQPFVPAIPPLDGEIVIVRSAASAFVDADLEARLDEVGATTLVLCGAFAGPGLEATARHAADLGYQVFVGADGQGAPAPHVRKSLTAHPRFNGWRTCSVLHTTQSFQGTWAHFSATGIV